MSRSPSSSHLPIPSRRATVDSLQPEGDHILAANLDALSSAGVSAWGRQQSGVSNTGLRDLSLDRSFPSCAVPFMHQPGVKTPSPLLQPQQETGTTGRQDEGNSLLLNAPIIMQPPPAKRQRTDRRSMQQVEEEVESGPL
eukprot:GSA120T00007916001.1